jgi:SAM-dependent methyltransferase
VESGESVVEVGCGTGAMLIELAQTVGKKGRVLGVEPQPGLAIDARRRIASAGVGSFCSVIEEHGQALSFDDESVDVALTQTVLTHLPIDDVHATLAEMVRITKLGGRVTAVEQDCDTWTIDHPDRSLTRAIVAFNNDERSADGWRGRQLPRLFTEAGLDARATIHTQVDTSRGSYLFALCERIVEASADAGAIKNQEAASWLRTLTEQAERGCFFSTINYVICVGTRGT